MRPLDLPLAKLQSQVLYLTPLELIYYLMSNAGYYRFTYLGEVNIPALTL